MSTKFDPVKSEFSLEFYKILSRSNDENILVSPYSLSLAMAMVLLGAKSETAEEIRRSIGGKEVFESAIHMQNLQVLNSINSDDRSGLSIATKLYPDASFAIEKSFMEKSIEFYQTEVTVLDFTEKNEESRMMINEWAQRETKNKIKNLLPAGSLSKLTSIVLANAVYFKGEWLQKFDSEDTTTRKFHTKPDQTCQVDMMAQQAKYQFYCDQELKVNVIELPYLQGDISMILLVPIDLYGLQKFEKIITAETLHKLMTSTVRKEVILSIPKLKMEKQLSDVVGILKNMGIKDVFDQTKANLQGMTSAPGMFVSNIAHKTAMEINEEGTEAAAVTATTVTFSMMGPPPVQVTCDHPFMFLIQHKKSHTILFMGRVISPE